MRGGELGDGELQAQGQQQQHDADRRAGGDELRRRRAPGRCRRCPGPARPADTAGSVRARSGGPPSRGRQRDEDDAELEAAAPPRLPQAQPWSTSCRTPAMPSSVPITTRTSSSVQYLLGSRRGQHLLVAHDRDDRRAGAGPGPGLAQRAVDEGRAGRDLDLPGVQAGDLLGQIGVTAPPCAGRRGSGPAPRLRRRSAGTPGGPGPGRRRRRRTTSKSPVRRAITPIRSPSGLSNS